MKIIEVSRVEYFYVVTNDEWNNYRRSVDTNCWEILMGDSWEPYVTDDIEKLFQEWLRYNTPNSEKINAITDDDIEIAALTYRDKSDDENTNEDTMQIEVHWYDKQEAFTAGVKWILNQINQNT